MAKRLKGSWKGILADSLNTTVFFRGSREICFLFFLRHSFEAAKRTQSCARGADRHFYKSSRFSLNGVNALLHFPYLWGISLDIKIPPNDQRESQT